MRVDRMELRKGISEKNSQEHVAFTDAPPKLIMESENDELEAFFSQCPTHQRWPWLSLVKLSSNSPRLLRDKVLRPFIFKFAMEPTNTSARLCQSTVFVLKSRIVFLQQPKKLPYLCQFLANLPPLKTNMAMENQNHLSNRRYIHLQIDEFLSVWGSQSSCGGTSLLRFPLPGPSLQEAWHHVETIPSSQGCKQSPVYLQKEVSNVKVMNSFSWMIKHIGNMFTVSRFIGETHGIYFPT